MKGQPKANKTEQAQSIDLLYRIAKAIASVKDGRELLKIIVEYAQPVFGFYDIGLSVLDKSGDFYVDWATFYTEISPSETNLESKRQNNYLIPAAEPLFRYAFERVARDNKPFIENLNAEFIERFGDYPQLEIEIAHGYKQFLVTTLKFGGADIGILNFNSLYENHFETGDFELFQAIADLVSVAVANITANEEILEREQEKAKLLSISREIAKVQTRRQLLDVIFNRIKSIFPYEDAGLFYFCDPHGTPDPNGDCHVHLLDDLISEVNFELMQKGLTGVITEGTDVIRFLATDKAQIISLQQLMQTVPEHPHYSIMEDIGIKQLITIGIKSGGATIGMLCFNSCRENFYSEKDFPLFENITNQVAVALTNILANEEILERTREKSVLLSISEDIASARNAVELLQIICEKAQKLIPFFDTGILIVEEDGEHHYDLAVNLPGWDTSDTNQKLHALGFHRMIHPNSYVEYVMNLIEAANSPVIEDYEKRYREFDYPFFTTLEELGYQEAIVTTLKTGGKTFGTLWLNALEKNHFSPKQFEVFQTLADQVAVAVSNILANEEILEREKEKSQLLAISEQLATIRDKHDLFEVIFGELKPIFNFDDCVVALYDENLEYTRHIHSTIKGEQLGNPHYQAIMSEKVSTENNPHGEFINYDAPRVVTLEYFLEHYPHHVGVQTMKDFGLLECVIMPLRYGGRLLGTLEFHSKERGRFIESQMPLFRNFADQMAVAISNILANEEILEREREKEILLSISQSVAAIQNHEQLLKVIFEKIKPIFKFHDVGLFILSGDGERVTDWAGIYSQISPSPGNSQLEQFGIQTLPFENSPIEFVINQLADAGSPRVFAYDKDYIESAADADFRLKLAAVIEEGGYREFIAATLKTGGKLLGTLFFNSRQSGHFNVNQFSMFQSVADQLAVAISNILANEEILEREREKTTLLSISEAIATVRDKDELFGIFNDKLRPILGYDYASVLEADNERQNYRYYLTISDQSLEANELYQEAARFRPFNPYIESVLDSAAPVVYLTDELLKQYPNGAGLKLQQSLGVKQSIVFVLKNAGQIVGLFILHYKAQRTIKPEQLPLFRNIANQIAVALGNILANEEIERKLAEIKKLKTQLEVDNSYLVEEVKTTYNFEEIIGSAPVLRKVFEQIELVAPTNATVLLEGETGTGKELFARAIHNLSPRGKRPLIKINCAALPRELVESELFGHERGSFTGATERRIGKFELANNSTIFLDEIGELPLELQAKLLRVLQEQELERVGGKSPLKLDIRVIAATNRNLREEVAARRFRSDLYFRLNTVTLELPPLRERREDVPALAMHFVEKFSNRTGKRIKSVATAALQELMQYDFPGNIRELEHLIEESVIFSRSEKLVLHRPLQFNRMMPTIPDTESNGFHTTLADNEREHILSVLRQTDGRIRGAGGAAEILNIKPTTLEARMKRLGIEKRHIFDRP